MATAWVRVESERIETAPESRKLEKCMMLAAGYVLSDVAV
jgi:hypothetical protein